MIMYQIELCNDYNNLVNPHTCTNHKLNKDLSAT
jgi:hypothetical protein